MRTLQEKYNGVLEGNFSKAQFRRDAAIEMPQFVSTVNSFDDTVAILKNKGAITEAKKQEPKYSTAKPADTIAPDVLDTGIKFELDKKYGTLDVTPEQYEKAKEAAIKNLAKDVLYYVNQDSIQLDTPGEKMEKAKLKEGKEEAWKEFQKKHNVTDKTIKVARKDFEKEWEAGNLEEVKVKVAIPGQDEFEAEEGKDYSEEEADKYIANAKKSGATPMNTKFTKVNETVDTDDLRAKIANILKGQLSSLNKMGGDAIIEDYLETQIQAYLDGDVDVEEPMEVVNDFREYMEHNQSAAADFNADLEPDDTTPETLEEGEVVDLPMTAAGYSRGETYNTEKYGKVKIIDQLDGDDIPAAYGRFRVEKINEDDEESPEDYANANAGSPMHAPPGLEEDQDFTLTPDEREEKEREKFASYSTGKEKKALKEMFKKIIVNLINE